MRKKTKSSRMAKFSILKKSDSGSQSIIDRDFSTDDVLNPPYEFSELTKLYEKNSTAQKCIKFKAKNVIKNGWFLEKGENFKGTDVQIKQVQEFFDDGGDDITLEEIITSLMIHFECTGNGGLEIARDVTGFPAKMYNVPIGGLRKKAEYTMGSNENGNGVKIPLGKHFIYKEGTESTIFNAYTAKKEDRKEDWFLEGKNEIMFLRDANPNSRHYGISAAISLLDDLLLAKYGKEFNISQFEQSLMSRFAILVKKGSLSDDSIASIKDFMSDTIDRQEWNSVPILEADGEDAEVSIAKLQDVVQDGSFLELLKFLREEIYVAYGVPPILLSIVDGSALANQNAQLKKFYEDEIVPLQKKLAQSFNKIIKYDFGIEELEFKFITPDLSNKEEDNKVASEGLKDGTLSYNEKRQLIGMDAIDETWADMRFIHHNTFGLIPVEQLENLTSEDFASQVGDAQGESVLKFLKNIRNSSVKMAKVQKIQDGTEEGDESYQ